MSIAWHPAAVREAHQAYTWLLMEAPASVARRFQVALDAAVATIAEAPLHGPLVREPNYRRQQLGHGFRHSIIYRVRVDEVLIVAVMHQKRRPGYWLGRI